MGEVRHREGRLAPLRGGGEVPHQAVLGRFGGLEQRVGRDPREVGPARPQRSEQHAGVAQRCVVEHRAVAQPRLSDQLLGPAIGRGLGDQPVGRRPRVVAQRHLGAERADQPHEVARLGLGRREVLEAVGERRRQPRLLVGPVTAQRHLGQHVRQPGAAAVHLVAELGRLAAAAALRDPRTLVVPLHLVEHPPPAGLTEPAVLRPPLLHARMLPRLGPDYSSARRAAR